MGNFFGAKESYSSYWCQWDTKAKNVFHQLEPWHQNKKNTVAPRQNTRKTIL
jgi:hypothetical protein